MDVLGVLLSQIDIRVPLTIIATVMTVVYLANEYRVSKQQKHK